MPDQFGDALDRLEFSVYDIALFADVRDALRALLGVVPSPLQESVTRAETERLARLATSQGMRIERTALLEGRVLVDRTVLRDARGRFVARGGANVRAFLERESAF